jgi:Ca-activated chloride channel family protein
LPSRTLEDPDVSNPTMAGRSNRALIIAVAVGLLIIGGIAWSPWDKASPTSRTDCVSLELSSSTEKDELLGKMAEDYNKLGREFDGRCAKVTVHGLTSGKAMDALSTNWATAKTGVPEPQAWLPSTSLWMNRIEARNRSSVAVSTTNPSVTSSPLVVAMPTEMADVFLAKHPDPGWDDILALATAPGGWASLGKPEWGEFRLGRDHPELSSSGLGASIATFHAGSVANKYAGITKDSVADTEVVRFVHGVESSVARYSKDAAEFIDTLIAEDKQNLPVPSVSAIVMQEQLAYAYNNGDSKRKFRAIHPKDGTLLFDHPYIVLASATTDQRAAAADFFGYLGESGPQATFDGAGFRDRARPESPTDRLRTSLSIPDGQRLAAIQPPTPDLVDGIVKAWNATRREARVLLVLDMSGSMSEPAAPSDPTLKDTDRLELVKPAARRALDLLSLRDEVGLWTFSAPGPVERVPIGKLSDNKAALQQTIDGLVAPKTGATDLYTTVSAAYDAMTASRDPEKINAIVVLSDGKDTVGGPGSREALIQKIEAATREKPLPIFTISYSHDADPDTMKLIASTSKALHHDASDPKNIDEVFKSVFQNF